VKVEPKASGLLLILAAAAGRAIDFLISFRSLQLLQTLELVPAT
jgi:hypothetical protein